MLKKYGAIRHAMDRLHNSRLSNYEQLETLDEIRRWGREGGGVCGWPGGEAVRRTCWGGLQAGWGECAPTGCRV